MSRTHVLACSMAYFSMVFNVQQDLLFLLPECEGVIEGLRRSTRLFSLHMAMAIAEASVARTASPEHYFSPAIA